MQFVNYETLSLVTDADTTLAPDAIPTITPQPSNDLKRRSRLWVCRPLRR